MELALEFRPRSHEHIILDKRKSQTDVTRWDELGAFEEQKGQCF